MDAGGIRTEGPATGDHNMTSYDTVKQPKGSRPDWILHAVPGSAFFLGLFVFSLVLILHKRRRRVVVKEKRCDENKQTDLRQNRFSMDSWSKEDHFSKVRCMETQSYENVDVAIYSNQEGLTYYVPAEDKDDYVLPDSEAHDTQDEAKEIQNDPYYLYAPQNATDTDGESYENMEGSLYAQPRRELMRKPDHRAEEDYINPDEGNQEEGEGKTCCKHLCPAQSLQDTDGESYEDMSSDYAQPCSQECPNTCQEDEDSYERMESIEA